MTDNCVDDHKKQLLIVKTIVIIFITLIWKSLEILANCLPLINAIKSRIASFLYK